MEKGDIYEIAVGLIATEMAKKGKVHDSTTLMEEAIGLACNKKSNWKRVYVLEFLFKELVNQGKIEDAIYDWKSKGDLAEWDIENSMDFDSEEVEVKPKKKKKSVKKAKKSI